MTNEEILTKLYQIEKLLVEATSLMYQVRQGTIDNGDCRGHRRADDLSRQLFHLVEPSYIEQPENITLDSLDTIHAPRGDVSCLRLNYEIKCGIRKWAGDWNYPKTEHELNAYDKF